MTAPELQLIRLAQFASTMLAPATEVLREADGGAQWPWALGTLLEAGAWLCLGVELQFFPRDKSLSVLERTVGRISRLEEAGENWSRIVGNSWTEQLVYGNLDEALAVQVFRGALDQPDRLQAYYQAALVQAVSRASDETAARLQQRLLFESDERWSAEVERHHELLMGLRREGLSDREGGPWRACAGGEAWIADGLVRCVSDLEATLVWAAQVLGLPSDGRDLDVWLDRLGGTPRTDEDVLAGWVGRILGWRLSRREQRTRERLADAAHLTAQLEQHLVNEKKVVSPWRPDGFAATLDSALDRWEVMTGQMALDR